MGRRRWSSSSCSPRCGGRGGADDRPTRRRQVDPRSRLQAEIARAKARERCSRRRSPPSREIRALQGRSIRAGRARRRSSPSSRAAGEARSAHRLLAGCRPAPRAPAERVPDRRSRGSRRASSRSTSRTGPTRSRSCFLSARAFRTCSTTSSSSTDLGRQDERIAREVGRAKVQARDARANAPRGRASRARRDRRGSHRRAAERVRDRLVGEPRPAGGGALGQARARSGSSARSRAVPARGRGLRLRAPRSPRRSGRAAAGADRAGVSVGGGFIWPVNGAS